MKEKQNILEKKTYKLFLDDIRQPTDCLMYMHRKLGKNNVIYLEEWEVVRSYEEFVEKVEEMGIPEFVSYDHDLADEHYSPTLTEEVEWDEYHKDESREKTGLDCSKWLNEKCKEIGVKHPNYAIHSMNPIGAENIKNYLFYEI